MSEPADALGRITLVERLGSGGMGRTFLGRIDGPVGVRRWVAVKRIHEHLAEDPRFVAMFQDEAHIASRLEHPNLCPVIDFGQDDGTWYAVMPYVSGVRFDHLVRRLASPNVPDGLRRRRPFLVAALLVDVCEGLHAAHELRDDDGTPLDVVHRDVSPANVIVGFDGAARVLDFGVAAAARRLSRTATGEVKGTVAYAAPEVLEGRPADRRADVWALGVLLWEGLAGRRLFVRDDVGSTVRAVLDEPIPALCEIDPALPLGFEEVVFEALARDPDARFATARAMGRALAAVLAEEGEAPTRADLAEQVGEAMAPERREADARLERAETASDLSAPDATTPASTPRPRGGWRWAAAGLAAVAVTVGAGAWLLRPRDAPPAGPPPAAAPADERLTVAFPPFDLAGADLEDHATATSLAHLLASTYHPRAGTRVIGPHAFVEALGEDAATGARPCARAASLGATHCVLGRVVRGSAGLRLDVALVDAGDRRAARVARETTPEALARDVRSVRRWLEQAVGMAAEDPPLSAEGDPAADLERAVRALRRHDLARARQLLEEVLRADPRSAEAHAWMALVLWWHDEPAEVVIEHLDAADRGPLTPARRALVRGLRPLVQRRFVEAQERFEALIAEHPDDPYLRYGLFEALWHGGHGREAAETYRHLAAIDPRLELGLAHVADWALARGDREWIDWVLGRAEAVELYGRHHLAIRARLGRGEHEEAAVELAGRLEAGTLDPLDDHLRVRLVEAHVRGGRFALAESLAADETAGEREEMLIAQLALAELRGDRALYRPSQIRPRIALRLEPRSRLTALLAWAGLELAGPDDGAAARAMAALAGRGKEDARVRAAEVLWAGRRGDGEALEAARASPYPEAAAIAEAYLAARRDDRDEAAAWWGRAMARSLDGRHRLLEARERARAAEAVGRPEEVLEACAAAVEPPSFQWSWVHVVRPCRAMMARAAERLGRTDEARRHRARLVALP
ncbi:MAG TPA: protein kinase [Sandaracinaceae bacterium LLY-WYZ-13_1]|nr:protein kinase [Sandaracinaceae bacterium LLY-WYZ-13_1]